MWTRKRAEAPGFVLWTTRQRRCWRRFAGHSPRLATGRCGGASRRMGCARIFRGTHRQSSTLTSTSAQSVVSGFHGHRSAEREGGSRTLGIEVGDKRMASEKVKTFTDSNFDDEKKSGVVLVDFWAEWCGPCRRLAPTVDALATEFDGRATVAKLNVDENPTIPERYAVRGIPTLLLFKEGELTETIVGLRGKEDIAKMIERHLGAGDVRVAR